jgi:pSer/pThr/pTyr-binding forkhead associated (FHA) protein
MFTTFSSISLTLLVMFRLVSKDKSASHTITDKSSNGTFLNNRMIGKTKSVSLKSGDIIALVQNSVEFRIEIFPRDTSRESLT